MNEILLGLKLYLGVVLGKLAVVGGVFLVCLIKISNGDKEKWLEWLKQPHTVKERL